MAPPLRYLQMYNLNRNLVDITPATDFAYTRCHLVYTAVFYQACLEPGLLGPELSALLAGPPRPPLLQKNQNFLKLCNVYHINLITIYLG